MRAKHHKLPRWPFPEHGNLDFTLISADARSNCAWCVPVSRIFELLDRMTLAADGADWKLQAWVDRKPRRPLIDPEHSKLGAAYLKSGRPRELLDQALSHIEPLSDYETDLREAAEVVVAPNRRFFVKARAILKVPRVVSLLAEAKGDVLGLEQHRRRRF